MCRVPVNVTKLTNRIMWIFLEDIFGGVLVKCFLLTMLFYLFMTRTKDQNTEGGGGGGGG